MARKKTIDGEIVKEKKEVSLIPTNQSAEILIAQAINKGVPVETMERLLAMRRELKAEYAKEEYDKAMANFQADCPTIQKTKEVKTKAGVVAYRYAPIETIISQVKHLLKQNGLSYSIQTITGENKVKSICIVKHITGHSESYEMEVPLGNKTDIMSQSQVVAAASTFSKRYAFCNAFGILTGDEDTDGIEPIMGNSAKIAYGANRAIKQPIKQSAEENFSKAKKMLLSCKNETVLFDYLEKLKTSKNFTEEQKKELNDLISRQVDLLHQND